MKQFSTVVFLAANAAASTKFYTPASVTPPPLDIQIECPILTCSENLQEGICFEHDRGSRVGKLKAKKCKREEGSKKGPMICPFEINTNKHMWFDEML